MLLVTWGHADPAPVEPPLYGTESTLTHPILKRMCGDPCYARWNAIMTSVLSEGPTALDLYPETFPVEFEIFRHFVRHAFAGGRIPPRRVHKGRLLAHRRTLSDGSWLQYQFEYQAIEAQIQPATLAEYLRRAPELDETFFRPGAELGLIPDREWGMGHVNEDLKRGYPGDRPEVLRNRLVHELRNAYFWTLVGPDIEAGVHWEMYPRRTRRFGRWLRKHDAWLIRLTRSPDLGQRRRLMKSMIRSVAFDRVFDEIDAESKRTLVKTLMAAISVHEGMDGSDDLKGKLSDIVFRVAVDRMLQAAFASITARLHAGTISLNQAIEGDQESLRLEFRRIPAHADADEAARWIRLLQGHWQRALEQTDLEPLIEPRAPITDDEKIQLFRGYVRRAGMNPLDFAHFLPPELARRVPTDDPEPRWTEMRRRILCESALAVVPRSSRRPSPALGRDCGRGGARGLFNAGLSGAI